MIAIDTYSEVAILERLLTRGKRMTRPSAQYFLTLDFTEEDRSRMHDLAVRNQEGRISAQEHEELLGYAKAGCLLGVLQSRARKFLKKSRRPAS